MEKDIIQEILESGCKVSMGINKCRDAMVIDIHREESHTQYMLNMSSQYKDTIVEHMKECIRMGIKKTNERNKIKQALC